MTYLVINADTPIILKKVATYQQACAWAVDLIPADARAIVAPLVRTTLSKFTQLELELLVKATFPKAQIVVPGMAYATLLNHIFDLIGQMDADPAVFESTKDLSAETPPLIVVKTRVTKAPTSTTPAIASPIAKRPSGGVTGQVWTICDGILLERDAKTFTPADWKVFRAAVFVACSTLNPNMVATQYARWKTAILVD